MSERGRNIEAGWQSRYESYKLQHAAHAAELERRLDGVLLDGWEDLIPSFTAENGSVASRAASGVVLNAIAPKIPELVGGSADLASSTNTIVKGAPSMSPDDHAGRNFHFGIREHGMGAVMNGMSVHGGFIPYGATFLIFSDYMRPSVRLAAVMHRHVIYVYTHDSIGLGEDGPTHQPIEQLSTLRTIPDFTLIRPADASETAEAWRAALKTKGPVALVLTRQKLGFIDRTKYAAPSGVAKGAYVIAESGGGSPQVVLMASGSEVALILEAREQLEREGVRTRAVSMPSHELFARQSEEYRKEILPDGVPRVSIEAGHPMSWQRWVGSAGIALGIERFGASAPYKEIYEHLGITVAKIVESAKKVTAKRS
jgi:transketolase